MTRPIDVHAHLAPTAGATDTRAAQYAERMQTLDAIRHAGLTMAVAAVILFVFNSSGLQTWTRNLPASVMTDRWVSEADNWHDLMTRLGFAAPKRAVRTVVRDVQEIRWSDETEFAGADDDDELAALDPLASE